MKSTNDVDLLRELGRVLPHDRPDGERREAMRARLVAEAEGETNAHKAGATRRSRWPFVAGGFAAGLAAAAVIAFVMFGRGSSGSNGGGSGGANDAIAATSAAVIESSSAAELEHVASATTEIVRVHAGTVRLAVGERAAKPLVVKTGDAEIAGAGTYELVVAHDKLAQLAVTSGHATISIAGQHTILLAAGETWTAPIVAADLTPPIVPSADVHGPDARSPDVHATDVHGPDTVGAIRTTPAKATSATTSIASSGSPGSAPVAEVSRRSTTDAIAGSGPGAGVDTDVGAASDAAGAGPGATGSAASSPKSPEAPEAPEAPPVANGKSPTEQHFAAGWAALRANDYARAARELGAAADRDDGPLAADARYFQAVAYTRAGRKTEAEHAYVQFLDRAPKSLRRGRAAVALGRLIAERGDRATAKAWFESALADPDPAVAAAATAALTTP